jgi:signal transduction histidine kinase
MNVKLEADLDRGIPPASFDPEAMHRAVLNLVTNAIDAAAGQRGGDVETDFDIDPGSTVSSKAEAPKVVVRTRFRPDCGWQIDVVDNGPGVPAEERQRIFSLFESRKGARGTGLGLPVSAKIMREHGGEIEVLDNETGVGSCFQLRLPPAETDPGGPSESDTIG